MKVFISYRRSDSAGETGRLHDLLSAKFGNDAQLFRDVDSMELGHDFHKQIHDAVTKCDVLLAVIGSDWLNALDNDGNRRLDDPDDVVRLEISTALAKDPPSR